MKTVKIMEKSFLVDHLGELKTATYLMFISLNIDIDIVKIIMWLMLFDTIFGIIKAVVLKDEISKGILFFGLITKMLILTIPMVLALVGKGLGYDFTPLVNSVMKILVLAEGFSIISSMYSIKTKERVKDVDIISLLLSSLRKMIMETINILLKKIEKPIE